MKAESFYKLVIIFLLLLNLGTLGYLLSGNTKTDKHHGPPPPPDRIIIERLELSPQQVEQFNELKHEHHSQMLQIQEESGKLHKVLFTLLKQDTQDPVVKDSILQLIQVTNMNKELVTFEHFQKLRHILTEKQKAEFDEFVEDISHKIMGPHRRH